MKLAQNHKVAIKIVTAKFMEKSAIRSVLCSNYCRICNNNSYGLLKYITNINLYAYSITLVTV